MFLPCYFPFPHHFPWRSYSGRATSVATILLGSILYTWFKHREQKESDEKQASSSSQTTESNGHKYQELPHDEDIELGARGKDSDSVARRSVG